MKNYALIIRSQALQVIGFVVFPITLLVGYSASQAQEKLPTPLTLEYALSLATDGTHPQIQSARHKLDIATARYSIAQSDTAIKSNAQLNVRWVQPSAIAQDQTRQDHSLNIVASKRLFDFGQSTAKVAASAAEVESQKWSLQSKLDQRRIAIMQSFFNVLLADLKFEHENEATAMAFLIADRAKDRNKLGQVSDIEVLKKEADYQTYRRSRYGSQLQQRITRAKLAALLNHSGQLPDTLDFPKLTATKENIPDIDQLTVQAISINPVLLALRTQLVKLQKTVEIANKAFWPKVDGTFEVATYAREISSRDDWRTSIVIDFPLYSGGKLNAEKLQKEAEYQYAASELALKEIEVKQTVLELWSELKLLLVQREEMNTLMNYRKLYMDRSRTLYELEVKADIGDAMVQISNVRWQSARTEYMIAIVREKLKAITGTM